MKFHQLFHHVLHAGGAAILFSSNHKVEAANQCVAPKINEFEPNPSGTDPSIASVEILCSDANKGNASLFSGWLVSIESDSGPSQGLVDSAEKVSGTFDSNGILVVDIADLENPSFTFVLMENFTGTIGSTDIDSDNDGIVDDSVPTFRNIYDAIGIPDRLASEPLYGDQLGGVDLPFTGVSDGNEPRLVYRDGANIGTFYVLQDPDNGIVKAVQNGRVTDLSASEFIGQDPFTASFGSVNPSTALTPSPAGTMSTPAPTHAPFTTKVKSLTGCEFNIQHGMLNVLSIFFNV